MLDKYVVLPWNENVNMLSIDHAVEGTSDLITLDMVTKAPKIIKNGKPGSPFGIAAGILNVPCKVGIQIFNDLATTIIINK